MDKKAIEELIAENKFIAMIGVIVLGFIQLGAWYMGFDGQVTIAISGAIAYILGIITKSGYDKIKK